MQAPKRMIDGYRECMEWAEAPDGDSDSILDFYPEARKNAEADCQAFLDKVFARLPDFYPENGWEQLGYDFWLTRRGHGCGFWDGDWPEPDATVLTDIAHTFPRFD